MVSHFLKFKLMEIGQSGLPGAPAVSLVVEELKIDQEPVITLLQPTMELSAQAPLLNLRPVELVIAQAS